MTPDQTGRALSAGARPADTLVDLIAESVQAFPDAIAVRCRDASISYRDLWTASAATSARLRAAGARPRDLIGVWAARDVDLIVALVAVLRAGCAYVALEPTYPPARLRAVAERAALSLVLAPGPDSQAARDVGIPGTVVEVAAEAIEATAPGEAAPLPDDLAYVMFTSGSTGQPKGVMIEHRSVVNLLRHMSVAPGLAAGQVLLGVTTPAFDLSVPDLFLPLVTAATLHLATAAQARDPKALAALLAEVRPDVMQATPATWRMLCERGWPGSPGLRAICGGEGYPAELARTLLDRVAELWNFYGPTETTVWSVCQRLGVGTGDHGIARGAAGDQSLSDPLPMGRPIRGTYCVVADEVGRPCRPDEIGELLIGGVGLARGYLGDPERTAEQFVLYPTAHGEPTLVYRTGDLVRSRADGTLSFVGRRDHQVKVSGFRIELGEIEVALAAQPGVAQAVCVVSDSSGVAWLVAYVLPRPGHGPLSEAELRDGLAAQLPPHMVPARVVALQQFPLTANGKIDRAALPAPSPAAQDRRGGVEPQGPLEELVAQTWQRVLGVPKVYADDDFFALGAQSLDAGRVAVRLSDELGLDVGLALVFRAPTVSELALALLGLLAEEDAEALR